VQTYEIRDHPDDYTVHQITKCSGRHEASTDDDPWLSGTSKPPTENNETKHGYHDQAHQLHRGFT